MNIEIPGLALGIVTLLGFFATYAVAFLNGVLPFVKTPWQKKVVSVVVAIILAVVVIVFYYQITSEPIGNPWVFALYVIVVVNAAYALVTRDLGAKQVEAAASKNGGEGPVSG